jgi:hypothetical protein
MTLATGVAARKTMPTGTAVRLERIATWIFVLPSLIGYVRMPDGENHILPALEAGLCLLLGVAVAAVVAGSAPLRDLTVIALSAAAFFGLFGGYALAWPHLKGWAFAEPQPKLALAAVLYCCAAVLYARLFYVQDVFIEVFWKATAAAIVVAVGAYALNEFIGSGWLVHRQYGTPRLQGFLSEPSAWAPFLPALLLLALSNRRYVWATVLLLVAALTKSPTVLLSTAGSLTIWYVIIRKRSSSRYLALGASLLAGVLAVRWLAAFGASRMLSTSLFDQFVGRLASGIRAVDSGGAVGRNARFASTQAVIDQLSWHDWLWTGIGPGSEGYIEDTTTMLPNALPVYVLASFGLVGLVVLAILLVRTVVVLRTHAAFGIFLAFIVASTVNSADGWESYKFVVVAVVVGWGAGRRAGSSRSPAAP